MNLQPFSMAVLAILFTIVSATEADARRRSSTSEKLEFVAETEMTDSDGQPLSLCILTSTESALFINFWVSAETYAMAPNRCDATQYHAVDEAMFATLQSANQIPVDLPVSPKLSVAQTINGAWGIGLGGAVLAYAGFGAFNRSKRRKSRQAEMGNASPEAVRILDIICHAAKSDGHIDPGEIAAIQDIAQQMTGEQFSPEAVVRMIDLSESKLDAKGYKKLCKGIRGDMAVLSMKAALTIVAADGELAGKEKEFIGGLAGAFGMGSDQVMALLAEVVKNQQT